MLPPGPERRALMHRLGIKPCLLDYTDYEWTIIVANADATDTAAAPAESPPADPPSRTETQRLTSG
ncbi:hypothetical protein L2K70_17325 [Nocardioides KLBMP 9356]|uniref:Uncharacterized protein n=1 Tax=Nocardioides potassii TaxID=2911371 RepID=A0ABS9HDV7_9ACTN|nr:hypothetical protein [Nocardioides potassii]MCF6379375.1 hypothetical protein [Nocardioides potassii]